MNSKVGTKHTLTFKTFIWFVFFFSLSDTHLHTNMYSQTPNALCNLIHTYTHTHKVLADWPEINKEGRDAKSFTTHLQPGWVMASREEINSRRGDTIKAVHGPTSRYCRQVLIHKAGVSPEQRERQEALLLSLSGLWITKAYHCSVRGELGGIRLRLSLLWESKGFMLSGCCIIDEAVCCVILINIHSAQ